MCESEAILKVVLLAVGLNLPLLEGERHRPPRGLYQPDRLVVAHLRPSGPGRSTRDPNARHVWTQRPETEVVGVPCCHEREPWLRTPSVEVSPMVSPEKE